MMPSIVWCVWAMVGMVLSETQTLGFALTVRELLEKARAALEAAGWDVDLVVSRIDAMRSKAVSANEEQEIAKRHQKATTEAVNGANRELYLGVSGYLDMAIAAVGKGTEDAKNLRRYRSRIRRPDATSAVPLPVTLPPK